MSVIRARDLAPGDRFIGKGERVFVVLSTSPASDIIRVVGPDKVIQSTVPPAERMVTVLNRDDSLTVEQAQANIREAGLT